MEGRLPALPGEFPTQKDWEDHLTTIFPEVSHLRKSQQKRCMPRYNHMGLNMPDLPSQHC